MSGGIKYDGDKPRMDLLDPFHLRSMSEVLRHGVGKYAADNWRKGLSTSRLLGAALRHLLAYQGGEVLDPESGLPHLAHAACCIQFLHWTHEHKPEMQDLWHHTRPASSSAEGPSTQPGLELPEPAPLPIQLKAIDDFLGKYVRG